METKTLKQLLKLIALILVLSYTIDKVAFFSLNAISDNVMSGQAIGKLNQFLKVKDTTNLLVFGNSRANHHIVVDKLNPNAYNMGINGIGIAYNSTLINTLNPKKKQTVIVHVDTKNFFNDTYDGSDIRGLKTKYNRIDKITSALNESGKISSLQNIFYTMNYNGSAVGILKNFIKPKYNHLSYNGYDPLVVSKSKTEVRDYMLKNDIAEKCTDNHKVNPTALAFLEKIESFTEESKNNKTFIFVTSPIHNDACAVDNKILADILNKKNLTFWDFTNLYKTNNDDSSLWKDKTHMSNLGAEKFTTHLLKKYQAYTSTLK
ncbi:hypothetical protein [uncultured Winogradskyella sp.]|uniref:hypothetical protein n=1 Tax=uncultured Winogradskyella sp. TaxID=395353 RepID=UPI0030D822BB|tara:strand:+ start:127531 stop:128487 length:957 start_codon:yes stop_codon:yes gene_type:complete